jgi:hypothetical protein
VIANAGSGELRFYSSDGRYEGAAGRSGEGPGEVRSLAWLGRSEGDSLLMWDSRLGRVSIFDAAGEYGRSYAITLPDVTSGAAARGGLADGRLVISRGASFVPVDGAGVQRQPLRIWLVSTGGEPRIELGPFPGESVELRGGLDASSIIRTLVPFGAASLIAAGEDRIAVTDNTSYDLHIYLADGRLHIIARRPHDPLPVSAEDLAADLDARLTMLPPIEDIRAGIRASWEAVPKPELLPAIRSMIVDRAGFIWVEAGRHVTSTMAAWSVFDREGLWLGDIGIAADLAPLEIGEDYLLVLRSDDLGVESVRLMSLARGR